MVGDLVAAVRAGFTRLGDDGGEIAEVRVFQHAGEFARRPEFVAFRVQPLDALERVAGGGHWQLTAHGILFTRSHGSDEEQIVHTF